MDATPTTPSDDREFVERVERYLKSCQLKIMVTIDELDRGSMLIYGRIELRNPNGEVLLQSASEQYR